MEEKGFSLYHCNIASGSGGILVDRYKGNGVNVDVYIANHDSYDLFNGRVAWAIALDGPKRKRDKVRKDIIRFFKSLDRETELC